MTTEQKNEHYRILNDRFDNRAAVLLQNGFKHTHYSDYCINLFVRPRLGYKIPEAIQASFVMHADDVCWADKMVDITS